MILSCIVFRPCLTQSESEHRNSRSCFENVRHDSSESKICFTVVADLQQPHLAASLPNLQSLRSNVRRRTELRALREEYEVLSRDLRTKGGSGNLSGFSDVWVSSFSSCAQALPGQRLEYSLNYSVFLFCPRFCPDMLVFRCLSVPQ